MSYLAAAVLIPLALYIYLYPLREARLPYKNLPGPKPVSGFFGSLLELTARPLTSRYSQLKENYGTTARFRALLGKWRIVSTDLTAITHVLRHTGTWHRHETFNVMIDRITGRGVLSVEDEDHRRQRRILNSAFNGTAVNNMVPMFWEEGRILRDHIDQQLGGDEAKPLDVLQNYTGIALSIIGRAGFNYDFQSHERDTNPLAVAFNNMINASLENKMAALLQNVFALPFNVSPTSHFAVKKSRSVVDRIGAQIVSNRKAEIARDHISLEKGEYDGKDVISLCLRANMLADQRDRLTDAEVMGQIGALMLAGNETSANALSWATYHLCMNKDIQNRLREEVMAVPDEPTGEELDAIPYLDRFVKELLRLEPPLPQVVRQASEDTVIPLGQPVTGRDGKVMTEVYVSKDTDFVVPINLVNRLPEIWGPDAETFNPDRWEQKGYPNTYIPGVWGNLLSFIGGPHHCLGFRFALLEIKAVLFVMMRNYEFEFIPQGPTVKRVAPGIIQRPVVDGNEKAGIQMPVMVKKLPAEMREQAA